VEGLTNIQSIHVGSLTSSARDEEGNYYFWGNNGGMYGNGSQTSSKIPVKIESLNIFVQMTIGKGHICGLKDDGQVFCWGSNQFSEVGNKVNSTTPFLTPQLVLGVEQVKSIDAGYHHTCALTKEEEVYCWGYNKMGQMGRGTYHNQNEAKKVLGLSNTIKSLNSARTNVCAVQDHSKVVCWGVPRHRLFKPSSPVGLPTEN